jgi:hypothetical protein
MPRLKSNQLSIFDAPPVEDTAAPLPTTEPSAKANPDAIIWLESSAAYYLKQINIVMQSDRPAAAKRADTARLMVMREKVLEKLKVLRDG